MSNPDKHALIEPERALGRLLARVRRHRRARLVLEAVGLVAVGLLAAGLVAIAVMDLSRFAPAVVETAQISMVQASA